MDKLRITKTDAKLIDEWLTDMSIDPVKAFSSRTGEETRLLAMATKQLLKAKDDEINSWIDVYSEEIGTSIDEEDSLIHLAVEYIKAGETFDQFSKNEMTANVPNEELMKLWNATWFSVGMTKMVNQKILENMTL